VSDDFARLIEPLARHFFGEANTRLSSKGELRFGHHGSMSVDLEKGTWYDHEAQAGGGVLDLVKSRKSFSETRDALAWLDEQGYLNGKHPTHRANAGRTGEARGPALGVEIAHYDYVDEAGSLLFQVVRYEPKNFRQRRPDGNGGWVWQIGNARQVPYRLPELQEALALERLVFIVEGEKDADNLWKLGIPATTNAMGAGKWRSALNGTFAGADVVIIADNDPQTIDKTGAPQFHPDGRPKRTGQDHAHAIAAELAETASRVRVLEIGKAWRKCPPKGDISDWLEKGGTPEALYEIIDQLPTWTPELAKEVPLVPLIFPFPIDEQKIPRRQWIIPGLLLRRYVSVLVAPPGIGKSLLTLQIGMAASAGLMWGGWRPRKRPRVLIINSEDDAEEMRRRCVATQRVMGIASADLVGFAFAEQPDTIVVAKADSRTKTVTRTPMAEAIIATIIAERIDVLIVDPFAETFEGDENSNSELKWAAALWREIARRTNAAVLLVHHTRKFGAEAGNIDSARGATALIGVARIVSTLFPMTEKEAEVLDDANKRTNYLRYDDAKANLTLVTLAARWFEKKTVTLDNAGPDGPDYEPPDEVGVLIPWAPPRAFDKLDAMTANKVLDLIAAGKLDAKGNRVPYSPSTRGRSNARWAGLAVQELVVCSDKQAGEIIDTWTKNGMLEEYQDQVNRKLSRCLRVVDSRRPGTTIESVNELSLVVDDEPDSD
jgi:AAA domain